MSKVTQNKITDYFQWACGVIIVRDGYRKAAWEQFLAKDFLISENLFVQWRTQSRRVIPDVMRGNSAAGKIMTRLGIAAIEGAMIRIDEEKWRAFCVEVTHERRALSEAQKAYAAQNSITAERNRQAGKSAKTAPAPRLQTIETDVRAYPAWMLDKPCGRTSLREVLGILHTKFGDNIPRDVVLRLKPQIEALSKQGA